MFDDFCLKVKGTSQVKQKKKIMILKKLAETNYHHVWFTCSKVKVAKQMTPTPPPYNKKKL